MKRSNTILALGLSLLIAACGGGGGGGGDDDAGNPPGGGGGMTDDGGAVPASAYGSVDAFVAYLKSLGTSATPETTEPRALGDTAPPVADEADPADLG